MGAKVYADRQLDVGHEPVTDGQRAPQPFGRQLIVYLPR